MAGLLDIVIVVTVCVGIIVFIGAGVVITVVASAVGVALFISVRNCVVAVGGLFDRNSLFGGLFRSC